MPERRASCSCGQLQAVVTGNPVCVSICHCCACQRRTGSSYGYQSRFPAQSVTISGQSKEFIRYSDEDAEVRRFNFCPECGATVFHSGGDSEDLIIPVGAFADPAFPPPQVRSGKSASTVGSWSQTRLSTSTDTRADVRSGGWSGRLRGSVRFG